MWGIKVSTIYPAVVDTEFITHTEGKFQSNFLYPNAFRLSAENVARAIWKVARSPRKDVILPKIMIFAKWLNVFIPGVIDKAIEVGFVRSERGL